MLYAKSWTAPVHYGDAAAEAELRAGLRDWCVDEGWFATGGAGLPLHALPAGAAQRGGADEVLDGPRSVVVREAHNRLWVQMAVLHRLLARTEASEDGARIALTAGGAR